VLSAAIAAPENIIATAITVLLNMLLFPVFIIIFVSQAVERCVAEQRTAPLAFGWNIRPSLVVLVNVNIV
jgi:hypothetical protein